MRKIRLDQIGDYSEEQINTLLSVVVLTADRIVKEGSPVDTGRRAGSYNTTTGVITETNTDTTIRGVLENINLREVNELIEATDKKIQIAAASLSSTPTTKDKVIVGSVTYSIIRIETNQFANEKLTFVCYLRT